jgi:hypothetical protein
MSQFFIATTSGNLPPSVPLKFTADDGNFAVPSANNLNVLGGSGGVSTSIPTPGGNTLNVNIVNDSFKWSEQNGNFNAAIQNGYYCNGALTVTLPATAGLLIGSTIIIYVDTSSTVMIQANTGQLIQVGSNISASAGTAASNTRGALLELNFKPSDLTWHTIASLGVWTVT